MNKSPNQGALLLARPDFNPGDRPRIHFRSGALVLAKLWQNLNLLYVRVPKAANTSIIESIPDGVPVALDPTVLETLSPRPITFSFVRNPWDRVVSIWAEKIRTEPITNTWFVDGISRTFIKESLPVYRGMPFSAFVEMACSIPDEQTDRHLRSQSFYLVRNGAVVVEFVGRFESIGRDWRTLMDRVGCSHTLIHTNQSARAHYSEYYHKKLQDLVADRYARDVELFGYRFETA